MGLVTLFASQLVMASSQERSLSRRSALTCVRLLRRRDQNNTDLAFSVLH